MTNIDIIKNSAFIFMKVGMHAGEDFDSILKRKNKEYEYNGFSFWGYGGPTCHPTKQIQPFVAKTLQQQGDIYLLMESINSKANPKLIPATKYSIDGVNWLDIPKGITVTGSKYALVLDEIQPGELDLPFHACEVAFGDKAGKPASNYIRGHVDKACLTLNEQKLLSIDENKKKISHYAKLKKPFAVFVK